jgi:hypothetical protein
VNIIILIPAESPRAAVVADMDKCEGCVGHLVAAMRLEALRPGLDVDLHRGAPDALHFGIDLEHVADAHRLDEGHRLDHDCHDTALRALHACDAAGLVHVRHHPAAEDVAVGIGVGRHRDGAHGEFAARPVMCV